MRLQGGARASFEISIVCRAQTQCGCRGGARASFEISIVCRAQTQCGCRVCLSRSTSRSPSTTAVSSTTTRRPRARTRRGSGHQILSTVFRLESEIKTFSCALVLSLSGWTNKMNKYKYFICNCPKIRIIHILQYNSIICTSKSYILDNICNLYRKRLRFTLLVDVARSSSPTRARCTGATSSLRATSSCAPARRAPENK